MLVNPALSIPSLPPSRGTSLASALLRRLSSDGPASRTQIARSLGVRPSQVTPVARELIGKGLVTTERQPARRGRPSEMLDIARSDNYAIGVKVESGSITAALLDWNGHVASQVSSSASPDTTTEQFQDLVHKVVGDLLAQAPATGAKVHGIGVGMSALVEAASNVAVVSSAYPAVRDLSLASLTEAYGLPVYLGDLAHFMGLGERSFVYSHDQRTLVFLVVADGTCGAILAPAGHPDLPAFSGEFGHIMVDPTGPPCGCGNRGCVEAYLSEPALLATTARLLNGRFERPLTLESLTAMMDERHPVMEAVLAAAGDHLGRLVSAVGCIFAPVLIVLGGSVIEALGPRLVAAGTDVAHEHLLGYLSDRVEVAMTGLGPEGVFKGCAATVMNAVINAA